MNQLLAYIAKRVLVSIPTLITITMMIMAILVLGPGEPKIAGKTSGLGEGERRGVTSTFVEGTGVPLEVYRQKEIYGLNDPWVVQYWHWLVGNDGFGFSDGPMVSTLPNGEPVERYPRYGVLRGDFGPSYTDLQRVPEKIWRAFRVTFLMSFLSTLLTYIVSIGLGVYSATHRDSLPDRISTVLVFFLYSMPSFWVGTLLILFLTGGDFLHWFPNNGLSSVNYLDLPYLSMLADYAWHMVLPLTVLTYGSMAFLSRYGRTSMLEAASSDFVRTARAKGLSEKRVIWQHIFPNALIPIITLMAGLLPALLGGSIVVEQIFSIPGMGKLAISALLNKDHTVIMAITALSALLLILGNLMSDLLYVMVDPRVSLNRLARR